MTECTESTVTGEAGVHPWRCTCIIRAMLAEVSDTGTVMIRISGRRESPAVYIFDMVAGRLLAHCTGGRHHWRELYVESGQVKERDAIGPFPTIGCKCERPERGTNAGARAAAILRAIDR